MGIEDSNLAIVSRAYELWDHTKAGSIDYWMDLMADRVDWQSLANGAPGLEFTRCAISRDDVRGYFEGLVRDWEMQHYTVDEYVAQGDRVVMLGRCAWKHRGTGKLVEMQKADALRLRDGKIVAFMEYYDTAAAMAAAVA